MEIRSLSREADRTLAKKMRVSEGVSGEGQAAARCAHACLVAKSWVFGILATWRGRLITCRYRGPAPALVSIWNKPARGLLSRLGDVFI